MGVTSSVSLNAEVAIAVITLAMGMMNATLSQVGGQAVSLTFDAAHHPHHFDPR
ncbi:MAG TPA: hypothetical protein VKI44_19360 [Acetobacteraceae bacterium]|nr:hypothetical protein [Acetobacteraceae bacterium]